MTFFFILGRKYLVVTKMFTQVHLASLSCLHCVDMFICAETCTSHMYSYPSVIYIGFVYVSLHVGAYCSPSPMLRPSSHISWPVIYSVWV